MIEKLEKGHIKTDTLSPKESECFKIINNIDYIGAHVPDSIKNCKDMRNQIWSLTSFLGAPTWFFTFAPADILNPISIYLAETGKHYTQIFSAKQQEFSWSKGILWQVHTFLRY